MKKRVRVREPIAMLLGLWWDGGKRNHTSERHHHLGIININRPIHIILPLMIKVNSPRQLSNLATLSISDMFPWPRALCHRTTKPSFSFQPIHWSQLLKVCQISLLKRNRTISSEASIKFPRRSPFDRSFIHIPKWGSFFSKIVFIHSPTPGTSHILRKKKKKSK